MPTSGSNNHGGGDDSEEIVYCHSCAEEWARAAHPDLKCPNCDSDFTEIIEPTHDPRLPQISRSDSLPGRWPADDDNADSDPEEGDIDDHLHVSREGGARGSGFYFRQRIVPGDAPEAERGGRMDNERVVVNRFTNMLMNDMEGVRYEPLRNFFNDDDATAGRDPHPRHPPIGRVRPIAFVSGPGGFQASAFTIGVGPEGQRGAGQGPPRPNFEEIFGHLMNIMPAPGEGPGGRTPDAYGGPPMPPIVASLQGFIASLANPRAAVHGDAVYTQEALDHIISQLMEQNPHSRAAPPATNEALEQLEKKALDVEMKGSDEKVECTICIDELELGEEVTVLPCKHFFHPGCVILWLREHNTCPICRAAIEARSADNNNERRSAQNNPWPAPAQDRQEARTPPYADRAARRSMRNSQQNQERLSSINRLRDPSYPGLSRRSSHSPPGHGTDMPSMVRVRSPSYPRDHDRDLDRSASARDASRSHWAQQQQWSFSRVDADADAGGNEGGANRGSSSSGPLNWLRDRISRGQDRSGGSSSGSGDGRRH